jgi:ribose transport system ATP-binding protein
MRKQRLTIAGLDKSFAAPVLRNLNLSVAPGEVHALVGENGAGKTTLANILAGNRRKDAGEMLLDGISYEPSCPADAFAAGVALATQELSIVASLSVAENVFLRNLPNNNSVIDKDTLHQGACQLLRQVGLGGVSPRTPARELGVAERQLLELAKALASDCRLLILDEPTAALTAPQVEIVHGIVAERVAAGTSIIYISHRLDDVLRVADTVSVMRDGVVVVSAPAAELSVSDLVVGMTGQSAQQQQEAVPVEVDSPSALEVERLTTGALPHEISFSVRRGEIVGIAGLAGSGRSALLQAVFGLVPLTGGRVRRVDGEEELTIRNATHAVRSGIGFLGEDRQSMGLFAGQSVLTNMMVPGVSRKPSPFRLIDDRRESHTGSEMLARLAIRCRGLDQDVTQLSGGNQQKTLIARWLCADVDIFLLNEPTRGVDVSTKLAIYELLGTLRDNGSAILVASSEVEELIGICDRILVLSSRKLVRTFHRDDWSETGILEAAFQELTDGRPAANRPGPGAPVTGEMQP